MMTRMTMMIVMTVSSDVLDTHLSSGHWPVVNTKFSVWLYNVHGTWVLLCQDFSFKVSYKIKSTFWTLPVLSIFAILILFPAKDLDTELVINFQQKQGADKQDGGKRSQFCLRFARKFTLVTRPTKYNTNTRTIEHKYKYKSIQIQVQ